MAFFGIKNHQTLAYLKKNSYLCIVKRIFLIFLLCNLAVLQFICFTQRGQSPLCNSASAAEQPNKVRFLYDVDFLLNFDNRESHTPLETSGTIFGIRLTPTVGVGYADSIVGSHRLLAGVSYIQPFGSRWRDARVHPTVYYQFAKRGFTLNFGFVPYKNMIQPLPDYLMSDSLRFFYPNIQGALLQYQSRWGHVEALADWRGMMKDSTREAFRLIGGGLFLYRQLYTGGYVQMNHLSHSEHQLGVCDDVMANPLIGANLTSLTPLDTLYIQAGYLMSWQRDRVAHLSSVSHGLHAELGLRWRFIGMRSELYYGGNAMPLYSGYGPLLNQGDPKYQARLYSRTDVYLCMFHYRFATAYAAWNFIYTLGDGLSHRQEVIACFNLDELMTYIRSRRSSVASSAKR